MDQTSSKSTTKSKEKTRRKEDCDVQFKVIIIGDSGVGKSCLLTRYIKDTFINEHKVTLGIPQCIQVLSLKPRPSWSRILIRLSYRYGTQRGSKLSDQSLKLSIATALRYCQCTVSSVKNHLIIYGVGSKRPSRMPLKMLCLCWSEHTVTCSMMSKRDIDEFKRQTEIPISFETSAKQNYNVSVAFEEIAHQSYQIFTKKIAVKSGQTKSMQLTAPKKQQVEGGCC